MKAMLNKAPRARRLRWETLEERRMLAVSAVEFHQIREMYSDLNLSSNMSDYNVIEILSDELSALSLRNAIAEAGTTPENDLIVVRTTAENNTVTLSGEQLEININAKDFGSVTIVSLGEERLRIDGNNESQVFSITSDSEVGLAGLVITNGKGGGINNFGTLVVTDCRISLNSASKGSGIYNYGMASNATLVNCTISWNYASDYGGGIYNEYGKMTVVNCVISNNTVPNYSGGGIYNTNGFLTVTNCTIVENTSRYNGGGIHNQSGTTKLYNSIVVQNTQFSIYRQSGTLEGYNNLYNNPGSSFSGSNNFFYQSDQPLFDVRDGNYRLVRESQAINRGNNQYAINAGLSENSLDMAGNPRFVGVAIDIGAYEFYFDGIVNENHSTIVTTLDDIVDPFDGQISLREAIAYATEADSVITFDPALFADGAGTITLRLGELVVNSNITISGAGQGLLTIDADQKSRVFFISEGMVVYLDGLSITGGKGTNGGGIYNHGALTVTNSTISGNTASCGGGIHSYNASLTLKNCMITGNFADHGGGGIDNLQSEVIIDNTIISNNQAAYGGGIAVSYGNIFATNVQIIGNEATQSNGGGIAIYNNLYRKVELANTLIADNTAPVGGGIYQDQGSIGLKNVTIANNTATERGGGIAEKAGGAGYFNSIIAGNNAPDMPDYVSIPGGSGSYIIYMEYTLIGISSDYNAMNGYQGCLIGDEENPIDSLFVDKANGNYRLNPLSPAVDAGKNSQAVDPKNNPLTIDLDGNPRIQGGTVDMGAYEYQVATPTKLDNPVLETLSVIDGNTISVTWATVANASDYVVEYATADTFADKKTVTATGTSTTLTGLTANTTYYVRIIATGTGMYSDSDYSAAKSATTPPPPLNDITMPSDGDSHDWTIRMNPSDHTRLEIVDLKNDSIVHFWLPDTLEQLTVNSSGTANDSLTVDFSNGAFSLDNGIQFNGHEETFDTLNFIGTDGNDAVYFSETEKRFNDLAVFTQDVENFSLDAGEGFNEAFMIGTESGNLFNVSDNSLVMIGGGYHLKLRNFTTIDAFATGRNDKTYIYAANDSFIVMNDIFVERRTHNQLYRIWHSKQVIAINEDDTNNAILHWGSRGSDIYQMAQGYGMATNAVGSYYHEFIGFENVIVPQLIVAEKSLQPTSQPLSQAASSAMSASPVSAVSVEQPFVHDRWDDNWYALLAELHVQEQRKKNQWYEQDDDWLAEFEKLVLLELRK